MPTIEFSTFNEETVRDFKPVLAKSVKPEWWNNMHFFEYNRGHMGTGIRSCPAMDDWLKSGWYLVSNRDMFIKNGTLTDDENEILFSANEYGDKGDSSFSSPSHPQNQMDYAFQYIHDEDAPVRGAFKMRNPWNITTPEGYSTLYLDPFLFQNKFFAAWQGIIDTDKFNTNYDNAQIIFYPRVGHSFIIPKGTPLVQVIPYKREEWQATYLAYNQKTWRENSSLITSHTDNPSMEEFGRIPDTSLKARHEEHKLGGYRVGKLHAQKGGLYKQENPPPECPYHVSEDSPEIQLELDLDD